jgi:hypothetical protein
VIKKEDEASNMHLRVDVEIGMQGQPRDVKIGKVTN